MMPVEAQFVDFLLLDKIRVEMLLLVAHRLVPYIVNVLPPKKKRYLVIPRLEKVRALAITTEIFSIRAFYSLRSSQIC